MYAEEKLKIAMLSLLETEPFKNITVTKVCLHSNVSRPTFYHHYTSLANLAFQSVLYKLTREFPSIETWEDLLAGFKQILLFFQGEHALCSHLESPDVRSESLVYLEALLKKAIKRQETLLNYHLSPINEQFVARSYAEIFIALIREYFASDMTLDPEIVDTQCQAMLGNAVGTSIRGFMRLDQQS